MILWRRARGSRLQGRTARREGGKGHPAEAPEQTGAQVHQSPFATGGRQRRHVSRISTRGWGAAQRTPQPSWETSAVERSQTCTPPTAIARFDRHKSSKMATCVGPHLTEFHACRRPAPDWRRSRRQTGDDPIKRDDRSPTDIGLQLADGHWASVATLRTSPASLVHEFHSRLVGNVSRFLQKYPSAAI